MCLALFPTQAGWVLGSQEGFTPAMDDAEQPQSEAWQQPQGPYVLLPSAAGGKQE